MRKYLWLVLLMLWLPVQANGATVFYAPLNSDTDTLIPSGIASSAEIGVIDNVVYKTGGGSFKSSASPVLVLEWDVVDTTVLPRNTGTIDYWLRFGENINSFYLDFDKIGGANSEISIYGLFDIAGLNNIGLEMRNEAGGFVINTTNESIPWLVDTWYQIKLSWLWNDVEGTTELSINGDIKISSEAGDAISRGGGGNPIDTVETYIQESGYIDEVNVFDVFQQASGGRRLNFNVPFGSPFGGGFSP